MICWFLHDAVKLPKEMVPLDVKAEFLKKLKCRGNIEDMLVDVQVVESLGKGKFGKVEKGRLPDGRVVAIKSLMCSADALKEMWQEISTLRDLRQYKYANILQFFGYRLDKREIAIVTEFMELKDLESFLDEHSKGPIRYDIRYKGLMAVQIANGMQCLERHGIIHRDLACRNVLLHEQGGSLTLKISDFGLSRPSNYVSRPDSTVALPWSPPEVLHGKKFSHKSDVWSFAATFWEIIQDAVPPPVVGADVEAYRKELIRTLIPSLTTSHIKEIENIKNETKKEARKAEIKKLFVDAFEVLFRFTLQEDPSERIAFDKVYKLVDRLHKYVFCRGNPVTSISAPSKLTAEMRSRIKITESDYTGDEDNNA